MFFLRRVFKYQSKFHYFDGLKFGQRKNSVSWNSYESNSIDSLNDLVRGRAVNVSVDISPQYNSQPFNSSLISSSEEPEDNVLSSNDNASSVIYDDKLHESVDVVNDVNPIDTQPIDSNPGEYSFRDPSEEHAIHTLSQRISQKYSSINYSNPTDDWLASCHQSEILRFFRGVGGDIEKAWDRLLEINIWRKQYVNNSNQFDDCNAIHNTEFCNSIKWLNHLSSDGHPVLYIKIADIPYSSSTTMEDYQRYLIWLLEQGRRKYGIGLTRRSNIVMDCVGLAGRNLNVISMIPQMIQLSQFFQKNYPDILHSADVFYVNWMVRNIYYTVSSSAFTGSTGRKITLHTRSDETSRFMNEKYGISLV